jgi:2-C-methyl-D-erythritol 4-phosphate cytidylyltransferase / 2-C-methyl-D-erythritol 2,4-cyclodiphosphate synthase
MVSALLLAAGSSSRYGQNKLDEVLPDGRTVWRTSYDLLAKHPLIREVIVVASPEMLSEIASKLPLTRVVPGGESRQESCRAGFMALDDEAEILLVHDAARPFATPELVTAVIEAAREHEAAYPGLKVVDTIREVGGEQSRTLNRADLRSVQTPQAGRVELFRQAFSEVRDELTDDMALLEQIGVNPCCVPGEPNNIKVTYPSDLQNLRPESMEIRTGFGYDIHRFSDDPERPLMLGGVAFPGPGLEGHSDADVLLHAITDAVLGAAAMDDIGVHFPNTDPEWKNADSLRFLARAVELVSAEGWKIQHIDATILAEKPKVMPRRIEIRTSIANACGLQLDQVSLKATTHEGLGSIGRAEGIVAQAVATLRR